MALRRASRGAGPGPSGSRGGHWAVVLQVPAALEGLARRWPVWAVLLTNQLLEFAADVLVVYRWHLVRPDPAQSTS